MIPLPIKFINSGDEVWPDADTETLLGEATKIDIVVVDKGTMKGHPTVAIRADLRDGRWMYLLTTARLFITAANAIEARYPGLMEERP